MNPRKTLRIARWEVASAAGEYDRRTLALVVVSLLLVAALVPMVAGKGIALDRGIYVVGVNEQSPYYSPVASNPTFVPVEPDPAAFRAGGQDLLVRGSDITVRDDRQSRAAAAALADAVERYNDRLMALEPDRAAAYPVSVHVRYVERDLVPLVDRGAAPRANADSGGSTTHGGGDPGPADGTAEEVGEPESGDSGSFGAAESTGETDRSTPPGPAPGDAGGAFPGMDGGSRIAGQPTGAPSDIAPPFPFASLVLAFAFLIPMNFVVQAYGSSMLEERLNHRGEALLVAPVTRFDIIVGKTLPYLGAMVLIATATALVIGGGIASIAAVVPVALVFLGCTFLGAMLSRSFKELTFVTVASSVGLSTYVFVPAIFTNVHPIAAISPLTIVVRELEGAGLRVGEYAFATGTFYLAAAVLFGLGAGLYREEDLFAQRPLREKAIDALAWRIRRPRSAAVLSALSIPFVLFAELFGIALLFALPVAVSIPALLVCVAVIEEGAKSGHVLAGFARGRYDPRPRMAAFVGVLSGAGFFLGEKLAVVTQLVGLPELALGQAAFGGAGIGVVGSLPLLVGLLVAPLALHVVTATMTAVAAARTTNQYALAYGSAVIVHVGYNLAVVAALG